MQSIDSKINTMLELLKYSKTEQATFLIDDITLEANSLNIYLSSLITTHLKQAITEKQVNDSLFQTSTVMLIDRLRASRSMV